MGTPSELKYTEDHGWARIEGNRVKVGLTDFAQREFGDIVFVELPQVGTNVQAGQPYGSVESVKTVSELYAPVSGKVIEVNNSLEKSPSQVNASTYDDGWMIVIEMSQPSEVDQLWSAEQYKSTYESIS